MLSIPQIILEALLLAQLNKLPLGLVLNRMNVLIRMENPWFIIHEENHCLVIIYLKTSNMRNRTNIKERAVIISILIYLVFHHMQVVVYIHNEA